MSSVPFAVFSGNSLAASFSGFEGLALVGRFLIMLVPGHPESIGGDCLDGTDPAAAARLLR
jgi:hypothetical protein